MNQEPFIHAFSTSQGNYIYDVNTDKILKVPYEVYLYLESKKNYNDISFEAKEYIKNLKNNGFLKNNKVCKTEHPATELLSSYIENNLKYLVLQVTQNCNLRCDYCVYSGSYHNRTHSNKRMSLDIAKKGIDYLIKNSKNSKDLTIGFYGGEPLLEFDLIKNCVEYIETQTQGKKVIFNLTTNGTLLDNEILKFLVEKEFLITISLDGPEKVHDRNRQFANTNIGSFDILLTNLKTIADKYPTYFKYKVNINSVLTTEDGYKCVSDFFSQNSYLNKLDITSEIVSDTRSKKQLNIYKQFMEERGYEYFKLYLSKLGRYNENNVSVLMKKNMERFDQLRRNRSSFRNELPKKWHHGGPCIPGSNRLFVNVDGDFFPCEKVCETSEFVTMGNVNTGIDLNKAKNILNIENINKEKCYDCWIYSNCFLCAQSLKDLNINEYNNLDEECNLMRREIEESFKDYCVLKECGYNLDIDMYKIF